MTKLPAAHTFVDLSDYGRPMAKWIAHFLKHTRITPIQVTFSFIVSGLLAIICILYNLYWSAAFFLILKSILDAADGELARVKNTPSYTGRFLDSIADFVLNFLILMAVWSITDVSLFFLFLAFIGLQLQGTLYNYYYVILRNRFNGDTTSRVFEHETPLAMKGEKQKNVNRMFTFYKVLYGIYDKAIFLLDQDAQQGKSYPNWFMTLVSIFGLGFQLLIISVMLVLGWKEHIIPFFICYSILIIVMVGMRKSFLH